MAAFVERDFLAAHAGVEDGVAGGGAVVGHENENRVFVQPVFAEERIEPPEVLVDIRDHAVEARDRGLLLAVGLAVAVGHEERTVGGGER